jgi:hypothetical protein
MDRTTTGIGSQTLGIITWALGILGAALFWWDPMGIVLCIAGMVTGFIGWARLPQTGGRVALIVTGFVFCALALAVDIYLVTQGFEIVRLHSFQ